MKTKYVYTLFLGICSIIGGISIASAQYYSDYSYMSPPSMYSSNYGYYGSSPSTSYYNNGYYNSPYTYASGCSLYSYNSYTGVSTFVREVCQNNNYNYQ